MKPVRYRGSAVGTRQRPRRNEPEAWKRPPISPRRLGFDFAKSPLPGKGPDESMSYANAHDARTPSGKLKVRDLAGAAGLEPATGGFGVSPGKIRTPISDPSLLRQVCPPS